ncbi:MAG: Ryanodine receptor Ryr [Planctomycetia bacterium]|nr:Ryanodine receptor Ryr [Planctomycetia bacterium]
MESSYRPRPIDVIHVQFPDGMTSLVELLAEHVHDLWAEQRIKDGWVLGPVRCDLTREHPCLVSYRDLPDVEKEYDRKAALGTIKAIIALGYEISHKGQEGPPPPAGATYERRDMETSTAPAATQASRTRNQ